MVRCLSGHFFRFRDGFRLLGQRVRTAPEVVRGGMSGKQGDGWRGRAQMAGGCHGQREDGSYANESRIV